MFRVWLAGLVLAFAGCVTDDQERIRDYGADGLFLYRRGDYYDALQSFQAAQKLKPKDANLLFDVGQCYDKLGDLKKAERWYNLCLDEEPNHAPARHALARLLLTMGRRNEALRMIEDWVLREPNLSAAHAEEGWIWHQVNDLPRAQTKLQQALELDPHNKQALIELGMVYEELNRPDRARVLYERVLELDPNQPDIHNRLNALISQGAGRPHPE